MKTKNQHNHSTVHGPGQPPAAWKDSIHAVRDGMPFLVALPPLVEGRRRMIGQATLAWVERTLAASRAHPEALPATFDRERFAEEAQLAIDLEQYLTQLQTLVGDVRDTLFVAGSRAVESSRQATGHFRMAARTTPGLRTVADSLSARAGMLRALFRRAHRRGAGSA